MRIGGDGPEMQASALPGSSALRPRLAFYRPGFRQGPHSHHVPHVSIVVAGSFRETSARGERVICQGSVGFRADAAKHSVSYGPAGALILSLETDGWISAGGGDRDICWVRASARTARELLDLIAAEPGAAGEAADRLLDIWIQGREPGDPPARRPAPSWLREAAEHLLAAPQEMAIAALARRCGVHRVHFSRLFLRHYGMAPSIFRRRAMAARALAAALGREASLAQAAADGGFADQSHMARAVRECCGMGAGAVRRLLSGEATSVQSRGAAAA
jgi:AraC family transcriptional regulator